MRGDWDRADIAIVQHQSQFVLCVLQAHQEVLKLGHHHQLDGVGRVGFWVVLPGEGGGGVEDIQ